MGSEKITQTPPSPHPPVLLTTSPCVTSPQFSAPPGTVTPHTHTLPLGGCASASLLNAPTSNPVRAGTEMGTVAMGWGARQRQ